jgi:lipoprotein-releasing system permease protein
MAISLAYFISKRISARDSDNMSRPVVLISIVSIALGITFMMLSVAIVVGFQHSISDKVTGFTSHLQIIPFDNNESLEGSPIETQTDFVRSLKNNPKISHLQFTGRKAGVIKTDNQIQGVVFKGIGSDYDSDFLVRSLTQGHYPNLEKEEKTNEVLLSEKLAQKLNLHIGDEVRIWFIDENDAQPRGRKLTICGIYNTSLEEFDNTYLIGDLRHIQKLNGWRDDQVGSIEINLFDPQYMRETAYTLYRQIPYNLNIITVLDAYPQIFNWLDLLDMNVVVILTLLILVASITLVSTLLIIIIERTNMVGLLKAIGMSNRTIQLIFFFKTSKIVLKGMIWGNLVGLTLIILQDQFKIIKLAAESYYIDYVPVEFSVMAFLLLNSGTLLVTFIVLVIPAYTITHIAPSKALRYA